MPCPVKASRLTTETRSVAVCTGSSVVVLYLKLLQYTEIYIAAVALLARPLLPSTAYIGTSTKHRSNGVFILVYVLCFLLVCPTCVFVVCAKLQRKGESGYCAFDGKSVPRAHGRHGHARRQGGELRSYPYGVEYHDVADNAE